MPAIVRTRGRWFRWGRTYNRPYRASTRNREHPLSGQSALTITVAGNLTTQPMVAGSSVLTISVAGALTVSPRVSGASALTFTVSGALTVDPLDHWANIRPGDILPVMLPYAGLSAFCGYVRVLVMTYRDTGGDGLLDVTVQWLEPVTVSTPLRFITEGGAVPPPLHPQVSQVIEQLKAFQAAQGALTFRFDELEGEFTAPVPPDRMAENVAQAINDSDGGIDAAKIATGTLGGGVDVPATTLTGAVAVDGDNNVLLAGASSVALGQGVMALRNATAAPSGTPSGGGVIYVESGALKYKGSSGTVTELGPA